MNKPLSIALAILLLGTGIALGVRAWLKAANHRVTLNWQAPESSPAASLRYNIYRSDDDGRSYEVLARRLTGTTYEDSPVKGGRTYLYVVTTIDSLGQESKRSEAILVRVP